MSEQEDAARQFRASFEGKMCPILTAGALARPASSPQLITTVGGQPAQATEEEVHGCNGPTCMFFIPTPDERGVIRAGACVFTLLPLAISQVKEPINQLASLASLFKPAS